MMKELKDIIDQLEVVSHDHCAQELSALENALVIVGNVQKLDSSEEFIVVSPLNDFKRKFQFKIQDIEKIEPIENNVFKVFIKDDSSCIVLTSGRTKKRRTFDFKRMKVHSYRSGRACVRECDVCDVYCDSCVVGPCDSCVVTCDCDCYTDCYSECICDCNYVA
jgi:hypothetical protein